MTKYLFGNWKLFKTPRQTEDFLSAMLEKIKSGPKLSLELAIFPQNISLTAAAKISKGSPISIGAQNIGPQTEGAFTGETSVLACSELGLKYILLGHSERRHIFLESDEMISKKMPLVVDQKMIPVLCLGEKLEERKSEQTFKVLESQLSKALANQGQADFILAYEPVWAIGNGVVASPERVLEVHQWIKSWLKKNGFQQATPVLYGGSVKPDNIKKLSELPAVDGFLVGGASLEIESFCQLIQQIS